MLTWLRLTVGMISICVWSFAESAQPAAANGANEPAKVGARVETSPAPNAVAPNPSGALVVAPEKSAERPAVERRAPVAPPAQVLKLDKRRDRISITDDPVHPWVRRDSVCVFRVGRAVACGKVIAVGIKGAVVQLNGHTANVKPGDEARYFEPDKRIPEITDDQLNSDFLMDAKPFKFTLAFGYSLSLDLRYPLAHFYWSVSPTIAVGMQPAYVRREGDGGGVINGYGALLTVNYFSQEYFRGFWGMLGSGFYHLNVRSGGAESTVNTPVVNLTFGWREDWAHGLNIGAALGARFMSPLADTITGVDYHSLYPIALVEVGLSF